MTFGMVACSRDKKTGGKLEVVDHCLAGCPVGAPSSNQTLRRVAYTMSYNGTRKFADWVAYDITKNSIGCNRKRNFHTDSDLLPGTALTKNDYAGIEKALHDDKGHQAPLEALGCVVDWSDLNAFSNITPQASHLNRGAWDTLEKSEAKPAKEGVVPDVYGLTGPLYERDMGSLPNSEVDHTLPSGYWKIDAVRDGNTIRTAAFIYDQNENEKHVRRRRDDCGSRKACA